MSLSGVFRSHVIPRVWGIALVLTLLLLLPGCWIYSINPLYEENLSPDPDLVFDQSLVGSWGSTDNGCLWILAIAAHQQAYELTLTPAPDCKDEKTSRYDGHLVKLNDHRFLDVAPNSADVCDMCLPAHSFFLLSQENDALAVIPLDDAGLGAAMAQKKVTLAYLDDNRPLGEGMYATLTASSKDLKAFARKYADDKAIFRPDASLVFKRK
jgi:hypothetical protein